MRRVLVTGGAGFIGANLADRLLADGVEVRLLDDLSRPGTQANTAWLTARHGAEALGLVQADIRDAAAVVAAVDGCDVVFHLAGQTAVTTSILDPRRDFEVNALGTLNVLEAARHQPTAPIVVFSSTNKVYGDLADEPLVELETRWSFAERPEGIDEGQPLDLLSPYGCSNGCADQYVLDYHRTFGVPGVVLRQSCIYGERQLGAEDQGWVAWLVIAAVLGRPITVFGDGKQVRDLLHVDDLVDAYLAVVANIDAAAGHAYNIGGGPRNTLSVWAEFAPLLRQRLEGDLPSVRHEPARPGDQRAFWCALGAAERDLGWSPRIGVDEGLDRLVRWVLEERELCESLATR